MIAKTCTNNGEGILTCRSTLTILEDKLTLDSYTSLFLLPALPSIWSILKPTNVNSAYDGC